MITLSIRIKLRSLIAIGSLWLGALVAESGVSAQDADRKDVLILYGLQSHMPIVLDWDRSLRTAIQSGMDESVRIEAEFLDLLRSQDKEYRDQWTALLRKKYEDNDPDVVIAVFDPGLKFVLEHGDMLFPNVPVVFCSAHFYDDEAVQPTPHLTGVRYELEYLETLDLAKRLIPGTRKVAVVVGSSDFGNLMMTEAKSVFAENTEFEFSYLTGLSVEELEGEVAKLPDDSVILFLVYARDPQGHHFYANEVLARMSQRAPVPTFALWDTNLGSGTVGGRMVRIKEQGRMAGEIAVRIMRGEDPASIPIEGGSDTNELVVDFRELHRWGINGNRLPPDTRGLHRTDSLWQQYSSYILLVAGVIVLQSTLIVGLVINRMRRKRAERSLTQSRKDARALAGRLITAQEDERKRLAREMHDDLSQRLAANANEAGRLADALEGQEQPFASADGIRKELVTLADDVHRISRQLHPSILDDLGLKDALRSECEALADREDIQVDFESRHVPRSIPKTVALCMYRVAQEALRNVTKHAATDQVAVSIIGDDEFLYLKVQDHGKGFQPAKVEGKPGLGLASIKERIRLVEGTLTVTSQPGSGTTIEVRVPHLER